MRVLSTLRLPLLEAMLKVEYTKRGSTYIHGININTCSNSRKHLSSFCGDRYGANSFVHSIHAAAANCEHTVGDNIKKLYAHVMLTSRFGIQRSFYGTKIDVSYSLLRKGNGHVVVSFMHRQKRFTSESKTKAV